MTADPFTMWHPVASAHDVPYRHVHQAQLLGRELAVWRADDDYVNVWENRCLHRGVRLSIGSNDGTELRCQYHGWRYANRSAGCTYIPAHPADAPARTICNRTFSSVERYGLVWSGESPVGDPPAVDVLEAGTPFGLRNLPVNASVSLTVRHLQSHRFAPCGRLDAEAPSMTVDGVSDYSVALTARAGDARSTVVFFVQPVDSGRCVIRGVLAGAPPAGEQLAVWRHHATELDQLRVAIEAEAASLPAPEPMVPALQQVPLHLAEVPDAPAGRQPALRVQVQRKWGAAAGVAAFELAPIEGVLPTFQPGAHIDVHLPNGLVRQYSITNGPGESASYRIGVKLEPDSSGGSSCLHETVREGDVLAISEPRNNFPLRRDSTRTVLVAGGIGITPLLAMAQALDRMSLPFELHCFVQSAEHVAFSEVVDGLGESVVRHLGLSPDETVAEIRRLVASLRELRQPVRVRSRADAGGGAAGGFRGWLARRGCPLRVLQEHQRDRRLVDVRGGPGPLGDDGDRAGRRHDPGGAAGARRDHAVVVRAGSLRHVRGHRAGGRARPSGRLPQRLRAPGRRPDHDLRVPGRLRPAGAGPVRVLALGVLAALAALGALGARR